MKYTLYTTLDDWKQYWISDGVNKVWYAEGDYSDLDFKYVPECGENDINALETDTANFAKVKDLTEEEIFLFLV